MVFSAPEPALIGDNLRDVSVSELAARVKRTLEDAFGAVRVRGELGRVVIAKSGHVYFDLKDQDAIVSAIMWKGVASTLKFRPEEGLEVVCEGRVSTYPGRSQYQLIVERMEPAGAGALMALLDQRKKMLAAEGLFDPARKKKPPFMPRVIGVVTSPTGAVIRDILHRLRDRFPARVVLWPVLVQGERAASQIAAAIAGFNALPAGGAVPRPDVLIVARGGGSIEDLWAFNEEIVVRAAAASLIPLISAVGHETDTTLIDFAADLRAPTPTAAAELAVPVRSDLLAQTQSLAARLLRAGARRLDLARQRLAAQKLPTPEALLGLKTQRLDRAGDRLRAGLAANAARSQTRLARIGAALRPQSIAIAIARRGERLDFLAQRLDAGLVRLLDSKARFMRGQSQMLDSVSPMRVLARGYSMVFDQGQNLVRSASEIGPGQTLTLRFVDGTRQVVEAGGKPAPGKQKPPPPADPQGGLFDQN